MQSTDLNAIERLIINSSNSKSKIVVGIDGYSGIGKTTLLKKLAERNNEIIPVHRDDFLKPRIVFEELIRTADDKSTVFELSILDEENIKNLIKAFQENIKEYHAKIYNTESGEVNIDKVYDLSKAILVIEGIFLFHSQQLDDVFDVRIFLDGDIDAADQRRIQREKEKWGDDYFPETHPDSYFRLIKIAFDRYLREQKPNERANLVITV